MATTTVSVSVSDNNVEYDTPDEFYIYDNATHVVTTDATVSGSNSGFYDEARYENENGSTGAAIFANDVIIVTGANDAAESDGQQALINAQSATGGGYFRVAGPGSTVLGSAGNDFIRSYGYYNITENGTTTSGQGAITYNNSETITIGNSLYGEAGDDQISFTYGDTVYGGSGNDTLDFGFEKFIKGPAPQDVHANFLDTPPVSVFVSGDDGNDTIDIYLAPGGDTAYGGTGDDTIYGSGSNNEFDSGGDQLYGNSGNDMIFIDGESTTVFGGSGNDIITATDDSGGNSFVSADLGNDTVDLSQGFGGHNTVYGGGGDDTIYGSHYAGDQLYGNAGNDTIFLNAQGTIYGGAGNDLLYDNGYGGSFISGDIGQDSVFASGAGDTVYGGDDNDSILATAGGDSLYGNAGNDIITVTVANDTATVFGGAGDDHITVTYMTTTTQGDTYAAATTPDGAGDTYAAGTATVVTVNEGAGAHYLSGDLGNDVISGGSGGDTFVGGAGTDTLISHRVEATGNDPYNPGYHAGGPADSFVFFQNDSIGGNPVAPGTGSDITTGGGEAALDHITGFQLNVTTQAYNAGATMGSTAETFVNAQAGDNLYFLTGTHTTTDNATLDANVFYGTVSNTVPAGGATEQSDYAVAYQYAFGTGGTAAAETADNHFAGAVDFIVVDVVDTNATNNGNIFVFDHNGNAVALDGAGLASTGTTGVFQNSASPSGGLVDGMTNGEPNSITTVNIYH